MKTYRVGDCSTEYPVVRKPMGLLGMTLNALALTFIAWLLFYAWAKWSGVL